MSLPIADVIDDLSWCEDARKCCDEGDDGASAKLDVEVQQEYEMAASDSERQSDRRNYEQRGEGSSAFLALLEELENLPRGAICLVKHFVNEIDAFALRASLVIDGIDLLPSSNNPQALAFFRSDLEYDYVEVGEDRRAPDGLLIWQRSFRGQLSLDCDIWVELAQDLEFCLHCDREGCGPLQPDLVGQLVELLVLDVLRAASRLECDQEPEP